MLFHWILFSEKIALMTTPQKKVNPVTESAMVLAQLMKANPKETDQELLSAAQNLVKIYSNAHYSQKIYKNLNQQKIELIKSAIEDISSGVLTLRTSILGLTFKSEKIIPFICPYGSNPEGQIVYSIQWQTNKNQPDHTQEELNSAIYLLSQEIAKLLL